MKHGLKLYLEPPLLVVLALGFSSGLPLALVLSTLSLWLSEAGVDKTAIGLFASVATPYSLKFLWSPLVDGAPFPYLSRLFGHRRGWLIGTQVALIASILLLGGVNPAADAWATALAALLVAFCSATQDIIIDAYRVESLAEDRQAAGAAMSVFGYRVGMVVSSAGALYLVSPLGWHGTYYVMSALVGVGLLAALMAREPERHAVQVVRLRWTAWLRQYVIEPFADFMRRPQWLTILLFIFFYKFADAFIGIMTNPFLREVGFSREDIASIVKIFGFFATIAGSFIGVWMVRRLGIMRSLWIGGLLHGLTNAMFIVQARVGADTDILALGITLENVSGAAGTAAFVAYLSSLCNLRFTATQYALLSSLSGAARAWFSTPAGWVAKTFGWEAFFAFSVLLALPGLVLLSLLNRQR